MRLRSPGDLSYSVPKSNESVASAEQSEIDRLQQARSLLESGLAAEAEPMLRGLVQERPGATVYWATLARCLEVLGDGAGELEACLQTIALDPSRPREHARAGILLGERGEPLEAVRYLKAADDLAPGHPKLARWLLRLHTELARLYAGMGDEPREAAVWTEVLATHPDHIAAHRRLAEIYWGQGRTGEAIPHLRRVLDAEPDRAKLWGWLAHSCESASDLAGAEAAWLRLLALDPGHPEATERLTKVRLYRSRTSAPDAGKAMRLIVLGNCQAYAMAQCLRVLAPEAEIVGVSWAELRTEAEVDSLAASLKTADTVIAQANRHLGFKSFRPETLAQGDTPCTFFPAIHFTGFHPDAMLLSERKELRSLIGEWHSALILAAYLRGMPRERTAELFNAYIYGVLGYFDEAAQAEQYLQISARRIGWDLTEELEEWRAQGAFVHVPNHPRVSVIMSLARRVCANLQLDIGKEAAAPPDPFERHGDWPVYPEIGRRLGVTGGLSFVSPREPGRTFDVEEAIDWYYAVYAEASPESLRHPRVEAVLGTLRAEGL